MAGPICIRCGDEAAVVSLDLDDGNTLRCLACEAEYTVAEVEAVLDSWAAFLPWIKACPARQGEPAEQREAV